MRISRDEQLALVEEQKHSGLTFAAFCRERGICYQSFLKWRKMASDPARVSNRQAAFVEWVKWAITTTLIFDVVWRSRQLVSSHQQQKCTFVMKSATLASR